MEFTRELDHSKLMERLNVLQENHREMSVSYIGESVFGRAIPLVTLGDKTAQKSVLYVSTHHASENICTSVLLNFIEDYLNAFDRFAQIYQINLRYLFKMRKIYIVPMLNPDGVEYRLNGIKEDNPIKDRIIAYNASQDFSTWSANGRGVDLNHNYNAYFEEYKEIERERGISNGKTRYSGEYPESEPEVSALCNFIRYNADELEGVLTLHTQGEEIYFKSKEITPDKGEHIGKIISRLTGYKLSRAEGESAYGGLTDWFIKEFNKPSFTLECGSGENPLPVSQTMEIYSRLKELMFTFPILF
ncbi:MAG: hypothetical protein E7596_07760 [Ruminococcaceae bacterium]|nr:hypothetical protein [Oscillospiraceae bacterium]